MITNNTAIMNRAKSAAKRQLT